jgi:hypothetical protein
MRTKLTSPLAAIAIALLFAGCALVRSEVSEGPVAGDAIADPVQASGDGTGGGDQGPSVIVGHEPLNESLTKCGYYTITPGILGIGLMATVPSPLSPLFAVLFVGGSYGECVAWKQLDQQNKIDLGPAIAKARKETAKELKETFVKAADRLREGADRLNVEMGKTKASVQETGVEERRLIEKAGAKAIKELYDEIDLIKQGKFRVEEREYQEPVDVPERTSDAQ